MALLRELRALKAEPVEAYATQHRHLTFNHQASARFPRWTRPSSAVGERGVPLLVLKLGAVELEGLAEAANANPSSVLRHNDGAA